MRCTYCGSPFGETMDHVLPHSFEARRGRGRTYSRDKVVPSCHECNTLINDRLYVTIGSRANYLAAKLAKRYRSALRMPNWTPDQLDELERALRLVVEANLEIKRAAKARIEHCERVAAESPSIQEVWEQIDAEEEADLMKIA